METTESYVNCMLAPRAREIFATAPRPCRDCGPWYDYLAVSVVHPESGQWELGFIPWEDIFLGSTSRGFLYGEATISLFGPFLFFFQGGRWMCFLF